MSVRHQGYRLDCDSPRQHSPGMGLGLYLSPDSSTERHAIERARNAGWFVGRVRIVSGKSKLDVRTVRRVLCPYCSWLVGA